MAENRIELQRIAENGMAKNGKEGERMVDNSREWKIREKKRKVEKREEIVLQQHNMLEKSRHQRREWKRKAENGRKE